MAALKLYASSSHPCLQRGLSNASCIQATQDKDSEEKGSDSGSRRGRGGVGGFRSSPQIPEHSKCHKIGGNTGNTT